MIKGWTRGPFSPVVWGGAAVVAMVLATGQASAAGEVNTGYFGDVAIKGYDPVGYFVEGKAMKGSPEFSYRWLGATWRFANATHREMFASDPIRYAPQYGGHCADGVAMGTITTNIDPEAWRIIDGKLYINYDPGAAASFASTPSKPEQASEKWPGVRELLLSAR